MAWKAEGSSLSICVRSKNNLLQLLDFTFVRASGWFCPALLLPRTASLRPLSLQAPQRRERHEVREGFL